MGGFMGKTNRVRYALDFKLEAVRLIGAGRSIATAAAIVGQHAQTLHNWFKRHRAGLVDDPVVDNLYKSRWAVTA